MADDILTVMRDALRVCRSVLSIVRRCGETVWEFWSSEGMLTLMEKCVSTHRQRSSSVEMWRGIVAAMCDNEYVS